MTSANRTLIGVCALTVLTIAACVLAYEANGRANEILAANQTLAEELRTGNAQVELGVDKGTVYVRVNGNPSNIHIFPGACVIDGGVLRKVSELFHDT